VAAYFRETLAKECEWTRKHMDDIPCLLGEFGLPFDMNHRKAFKTGDYSLHEEALSMYYDAIDANLIHSAIWNYTADNTNKAGDGWNGEDLSIFSGNDGRAKAGWLRPYAMATAGEPLFAKWDREGGVFTYRYRADPEIAAPTELFIPADSLGEDPAVEVRAIPDQAAPLMEKPAGKRAGKPGKEKASAPKITTQYQRGAQRLFVTASGCSGILEVTVKKTG
jgi:hypothetical protein